MPINAGALTDEQKAKASRITMEAGAIYLETRNRDALNGVDNSHALSITYIGRYMNIAYHVSPRKILQKY